MEILVRNLKKHYSQKLILDIGKLTIESGKITGIIGPNGSGKSTLLNIVAGLDKEYSGMISYDGRPIDGDIQMGMTVVSQKPYLFRRRVYENLEYPLRLRREKREVIRGKVESIMERFEIGELKDKRADLLSGGESQKVSLARALVFEPKILLLDEPTSNIDPESIKIMERELLYFNEENGATLAMVTHNMEQAKRLCHNVIYLKAGKVGC